jgi:serine phosphatase RsbU (regulator of sigma subunit)
MTLMLPWVLAGLVLGIWIVCLWLRRHFLASSGSREDSAEGALAEFVERSLELTGFTDVVADAVTTVSQAFHCSRVVSFEPGAREGAWDVTEYGPAGTQALEPVPDAGRSVFIWFKHNPDVLLLDEVQGAARFGAMRVPLADLRKRYGIDVLVPLPDRGRVLGALGLTIAHRPTRLERALLSDLRMVVTAAAANVRLHREAAHKLTLEKEVDLASAVQNALLPSVVEGEVGGLAWVGHFRPAGQTGSDFWSSYELEEGRVLVVIGDVIGSGLAASMVSVMAKSCCDSLHAAKVVLSPVSVLSALNRALYRPARPILMTCFVAIVDAAKGVVSYANAGHLLPYQVKGTPAKPANGHGTSRLGVLPGAGPMLGDSPDARYHQLERPLGPGDTLFLYTDGLVEAVNVYRDAYGERRLQKALLDSAGMEPRAARDFLLSSIATFCAGAPPIDDEALVVLKVR